MTEDKKICAYCGEEIGTIRTNKDGSTMLNLHITERGAIEKCHTERKKPWSWLFGKRNYRGIEAWYKTGPMEFKTFRIEPFIGISFDKKVRKCQGNQ
jgi:hypothetical protein